MVRSKNWLKIAGEYLVRAGKKVWYSGWKGISSLLTRQVGKS